MSVNNTLPTPGQVRAAMPDEARRRSLLRAFGVLAPSVLFYLVAWLLILVSPWWLWPVLVPLAGLAITLMFIVAHDAAHDSLTPYRTLNATLARLLFLPAWHCYAGWVHAHNHVHHCWTNLQSRDYVWAPLSLPEYRALPRWNRALVRLYRWWPGFAYYYLFEILFKKILIVQPETRRPKLRRRWLLDDVFVILGVAAQSWAAVVLARRFGGVTHPVPLLLAAQVAPCLVALWLLGFVTYLQHTHPSIPWFQDLKEWNFFTGQVLGTTHTEFRHGIDRLIHNIMEHTAHHVDPRIPLYNLVDAQAQLAAEHNPVRHNFSFRSFRYIQSVCQLYDFQQHYWLSFAGLPTSSRTFHQVALSSDATAAVTTVGTIVGAAGASEWKDAGLEPDRTECQVTSQ
jgi:omega-6 fatty acid desaturase (delta-12 desaturase)